MMLIMICFLLLAACASFRHWVRPTTSTLRNNIKSSTSSSRSSSDSSIRSSSISCSDGSSSSSSSSRSSSRVRVRGRGRSRSSSSSSSCSRLQARVARDEDKTEAGKLGPVDDKSDMMSIPYDGFVGYKPGSLFNNEVEVFDPLKDTNDLPGVDGSEEKMNAIQARIQERVEALKKSGEWDSMGGDSFGSDPLARQSLITTMVQQVKACKPFDSVGDLFLTYFLVIGCTSFMLFYLLFLKETLESAMSVFLGSDFDSGGDVLENLMKSIPA